MVVKTGVYACGSFAACLYGNLSDLTLSLFSPLLNLSYEYRFLFIHIVPALMQCLMFGFFIERFIDCMG